MFHTYKLTCSRKTATSVSCAYGPDNNLPGMSTYATATLKKHELHRKLELVDKSLQRNYAIAIEVCDKFKSIDDQPECSRVWTTIEGMALVKLAMLGELIDIDDYLMDNKE